MSTAEEIPVSKQYRYAVTLRTVLVVIGVLMLGAGLGYWLSMSTLADYGCVMGAVAPSGVCAAMQELSSGVVWCLGGGVVALAGAGGMEYALRRVV